MRITLLFPTLILADFHIDNLRNTVVNGLGGQTSWTFVAGDAGKAYGITGGSTTVKGGYLCI